MFTSQKTRLKADNQVLKTRIAELEEALEEALLNQDNGALVYDDSSLSSLPGHGIDSEEEFWLIFDRAVIGIAVVDDQTNNIVRSNPALKKMLGYQEDEAPVLNIVDITFPED